MRSIVKAIILFIVLFSLFQTGPQIAHAQSAVRIGVFEPLTAAPGALTEVPVRVDGAIDLYAIDIEISFDPAVLTAEDADPASPGIQLGIAEFLDPGLVLYNEVNNQQGTARFVMTQVNPSEPKSGSGVIAVLYLKGIQAGQSALTVTNLQIADRTGAEIPSSGVNSTMTVAAAAPEGLATAIPVVNPTAVKWIPTLAPTQAAQPTTVEQAAPAVQMTPQTAATEQKQFIPAVEVAESAAKPDAGYWLVNNWWIVLIAAALVAGLGIYLYRTR